MTCSSFNTQPPEGGWGGRSVLAVESVFVSTHSRPKAAGAHATVQAITSTCFNTQPPEGGWVDLYHLRRGRGVSTHSRPKAAGRKWYWIKYQRRCFNTQPPEGGWEHISQHLFEYLTFQHTAARRRLGTRQAKPSCWISCFNTQPPEGGWTV